MQVDISILDADILQKLEVLELLIEDMTPIYAEIGNLLKRTTEESFQNKKTPWGESWLPWKNTPKVAKGKKMRKTRSLLYNRGALAERFSFKADKSGVILGTNIKYAPVHQKGRLDGTMAAREFMPVKEDETMSEETKKRILDILDEKFNNIK